MRPLNVVEEIDQTFPYLVALRAARLLFEWHPDAHGLQLAPGSLDIESLTPGLVGAETFAAVRPETRCLFMSGYTDDMVVRNRVLDSGIPFIHKPFTAEALQRVLRKVLAEPRAAA